MEEHARHELHETIIRDGIGKTAGQVLPYVEEVVMLEVGEGAEVVAHRYCHYIALVQLPLAVAVTVLLIFQTNVLV